MASNIDKLGLDASDLISALDRATASLKNHAKSVEEVAIKYVKYDEKGKAVSATAEIILQSGQRIDAMLEKTKRSWDVNVTGINNYTKAMKDAAAAQQLMAGAGPAQSIMKLAGIGDLSGLKASLMDSFRTVQQDLAKAIGGDPKNQTIATEIFEKLKRGVIEVETGIRGKIQGALFDVLKLSERIAEAQARINRPVAPVGPEGISRDQLGVLRGQLNTIFAVPQGAGLSSIASYQAAINSLMATVARSKISLAEFTNLFNKVSANPTRDFAGTNQQLAAVQQSIQRVMIAYNAMGNSAQAAGQSGVQAGRSMLITFEQFARLLEVQIIHRVFGNLITSMQQSISKAAELQVKIAEILTISQGSGLSREGMSDFVRQQSEINARPQTDVAEALYQGFSNQVIRTAADLEVFNQAMRLSRITVSSSADSMNLLSSVMRSYNQTNIQAESTVNALFKAIEVGRFRVSDIADTFGRISVVGAQAGVSMNELLAVMSHLSITGLTPSESMTQISAIMNSFLRPSQEMRNMLRSWGFESGETALRVLTLTGAIQRLNAEVLSGRHVLSEFTPNVRAIRGIVGARDVDAIRSLERQMSEAGPQAAAGDQAIRETPGFRFQQEMTKIQNQFLGFGDTMFREILRITEPWGGLANATKSVTDAIGVAVSAGVQFVNTLNSITSIVKVVGGDLGTLVKLYIDYKAAVIGISVAQSAATSIQSAYAALQLGSAAATSTATGAVVLDRLARYTSVQALTTQTAAMGMNTAAATANAAAHTAGLGARMLAFGASTLPILGVGVAIAAVTGQLDPLLDKLSGVTTRLEQIQELNTSIQSRLQESNSENRRVVQTREREFEESLRRLTTVGGQAFAELNRRSQEMVNAQRSTVNTTTENVRVAFRAVSDEMRNTLSELQRRISDAQSRIQQSRQYESRFSDRDQSDTFRRQFDAISRRPDFVNPIDTSSQEGYRQYAQENLRFQFESQQFALQRQLIQQRINTLTTEANQLSNRTDAESMQSARRKFEEIRRLTEQSFQLQTDFNRRTAEHGILSGTTQSQDGIVRYQIPLQQLQQQLNQLTLSEQAAEAAHRSRLEAARAASERQLAAERQRQQLLTDSIRQFERFSVLGQNNQLQARFRGPQGMANFEQDWRQMQERLQQALDTSNVSPEVRLQALQTLQQQYGALRMQIEREVADVARQNESNLFQERLQNLQRLRQAAVQRESEFRETRTQFLTNLGQQLTQMQERVNNAVGRLDGTYGAVVTRRRVGDFNRTIPELNAARDEYSRSINTELEAVAYERLVRAVRATSEAYDAVARSRTNTNVPGSGLLGGAASGATGEGQFSTIIQNANALQTHYQSLQQARTQLQETQNQITTMNQQANAAVQNLGLAAGGVNNLGAAAQNQAPAIINLTEVIRRLADQMDRLRNAPALPAAPAAPIAFEDVGFADGGLIGGRFNTYGPDDRLATVRTGEFVVNPESTSRFYSQLVAINAGVLPSFAKGGLVGGNSVTNVGDISISVHDSGDPNATARAVLGTLRRELRRGNGSI